LTEKLAVVRSAADSRTSKPGRTSPNATEIYWEVYVRRENGRHAAGKVSQWLASIGHGRRGQMTGASEETFAMPHPMQLRRLSLDRSLSIRCRPRKLFLTTFTMHLLVLSVETLKMIVMLQRERVSWLLTMPHSKQSRSSRKRLSHRLTDTWKNKSKLQSVQNVPDLLVAVWQFAGEWPEFHCAPPDTVEVTSEAVSRPAWTDDEVPRDQFDTWLVS